METKHTPGPWTTGDLFKDLPGYEICEQGGIRIAEVDAEMVAHEQAVADAKLIAAAPDLLAALDELLFVAGAHQRFNVIERFGRACEQARMALKKATE
jgi:hypothetical protein